MSRDYITGEEKIPYGPDETIHPRLKTDLFFNYDAKGYAYLDRRGDAPIDEAVVGVTLPGRCLSIFYAPTADADLVFAAASALVVEMEPITDGATGLNRASAIYARLRTSATCKAVQGTGVAGEFEVVHPASVIVQSAYSVLRLVDRNDGATVSANRAFITLRDYGTAAFQMPNLLNFWNYSKAESDSKILAHVGVAANIDGGVVGGCWPYNVAVRSVYGAANTPFWLLGTINPPTGFQDWHWAGSADGNHLFWDADGDQLSQLQTVPRAVGAGNVTGFHQYYAGAFNGPPQQGTLQGIKSTLACTGNNGMLAYGIYGILDIRGTADVVTGFYAAGAFEVYNVTAGNQCTYACIDLRVDDSCTVGGPHPARAYIRCRDKGNNPMLNLFTFYNENVASAHNSGRMIVETSAIPAVNDPGYKLIRCWVDAAGGGVGTAIWLVATTTAPAA